jgi:hypothetical protein
VILLQRRYVLSQQDGPHRHHGASRGSPPARHPGDPGQDRAPADADGAA